MVPETYEARTSETKCPGKIRGNSSSVEEKSLPAGDFVVNGLEHRYERLGERLLGERVNRVGKRHAGVHHHRDLQREIDDFIPAHTRALAV